HDQVHNQDFDILNPIYSMSHILHIGSYFGTWAKVVLQLATSDPDWVQSMEPDPNEMAAEAKQVAKIVGAIISRPEENIHIIFLPESLGRVAFGGNLIRS
ncbi:MAG: hypothetical protein QGH99_04420, partial [Pseudomonadales bacterium]|nr:hypothetical protein [Pseudomonadales bacterium]